MTTPMIERVRVEAFLPDADSTAFKLNQSRLGTGRLGDRDSVMSWQTIHADATSMQIRRGGDRDGLTISAQVGTLEATLITDEPPQGATLRMGTPIRVWQVRTLNADAPVFTGTLLNFRTAYERSDDLATTYCVTTLTAVDLVQTLANTQRDGAVVTDVFPWRGEVETFAERMDRYLRNSGVPFNIPNVSAWTYISSFNYTLPPGSPTPGVKRAADDDSPAMIWMDLLPGHSYTGNIETAPGYIGVSGGGTGTVEQRSGGRAGVWVRTRNTTNNNLAPKSVRVGYRRTTSGKRNFEVFDVTPGVWTYCELDLTSTPVHSVIVGPWNHVETSGSVVEACGFDIGCASPVPLASIVYESTLANHLDLAANSVRGAWWVDAEGAVQVRSDRAGQAADGLVLSDLSDYGTGHLGFVGIEHSFDTEGIATEVVLLNHGRALDPEDGSPRADDRTLGPWSDVTSAATYGRRRGEVETSVPYEPHLWFGDVPPIVAGRYLEHASRAEAMPSRVRVFWDPRKWPVAMPDVMTPVTVRFQGNTYRASIIAIEHEITPEAWHTTLELIER